MPVRNFSKLNIRYYRDLAEKDPAALEQERQEFFRTGKLEHPLERVVKLTREAVDREKREVTLSLSSEEPVERFFGVEILGHNPDEIDTTRLEASAPWLWMHDWLDQRGVMSAWEIKEKKLRVTVRLSRNPKGEELLNDMADGITPNTSVGYLVMEVKEVTPKDAPRDAPRVFRVTRWMPYEGSSVSVPADITVGVGRAMEPARTTLKENIPMNEKQLKALMARRDAGETLTDAENAALVAYEAGLASARAAAPVAAPAPQGPTVDLTSARNKAVEAERERAAKIDAVAALFPGNTKVDELCRKGVKEGADPSAVYLQALEVIGQAGQIDSASRAANAQIGLSEKDKKRYSLAKAMRQAAEGTVDGFEAEMHQEALRRGLVLQNGGVAVPFDVVAGQKRDLTVGSFAAGGALVGSEMVGFIELLRNKAVAMRAGVQMLTGLKGDIYIPRQTGAATMYWVGEGVAPTESTQAFGQIQMTPKTASALNQVSRGLLIQSDPSVDQLLRNDLLATVGLGMDSAILVGSGNPGVPRGIVNWSGIGSFGGGAATLAHMLNAEADIATANADDALLRWITTPGVREILKAKQRFSSTDTPLWTDDGRMLGYEGLVTNQMTASYLAFGDFTQDIAGIWGPGFELVVNPYRASNAGLVDYQVWLMMDNALRQAGAITLNSNCTA